MHIAVALPALLLLAEPDTQTPWKQVTRDDGVTVYARERKGTGLLETRATGTFDAPPEEVWKVLHDYENYHRVMPYTQVSRVVATEADGKVTHFYSVLNLPFIDRRDYTLRITDESDGRDGQGFLKTSWTLSDKGPPPQKGVVRVLVNDGYWKLEPIEGGKRTFGTYYIYTDPGGSVPKWVVNSANTGAIPDVFRAIRRALKAKKP